MPLVVGGEELIHHRQVLVIPDFFDVATHERLIVFA